MIVTAPVSPIHGVLGGAGTLSCNGLVHLRNPVASGKTLIVWEARVQGDLFVSDPPHRFRITGTPGVQNGGTRTTAAESRLDERDLEPIVGILEAFNLWLTPFDDSQAEWAEVTQNPSFGYGFSEVQQWSDAPIELPEGWAIEFETPGTGGSNQRVVLVWDEIGPELGGGPT